MDLNEINSNELKKDEMQGWLLTYLCISVFKIGWKLVHFLQWTGLVRDFSKTTFSYLQWADSEYLN